MFFSPMECARIFLNPLTPCSHIFLGLDNFREDYSLSKMSIISLSFPLDD